MTKETKGIIRMAPAGTGAGGKKLPFSRAVEAGGFLYVSGQVAMDKSGEIIGGGIVPQTEQTIANISAILAEAGLDLSHVIKVNVWLDDPRDFWSFNRVFEQHFAAAPPARSTVASALMVDAKIEMDVVAFRPPAE